MIFFPKRRKIIDAPSVGPSDREQALLEKLREAEKSRGSWLKKAKEEETRRELAEEELARLRHERIAFLHQIEDLRRQVKELSATADRMAELSEENRKLRKALNRRNGKENFYGWGTPSSKQIDKKGSTPENRAKRGGAKKGHKGNGRQTFSKEEADRVVTHDEKPAACACGEGHWRRHSTSPHRVINYVPAKIEKVYFEKALYQCSACGRVGEAPTPGVTPGYLYSDSAIANMLAEHYFYTHTAGSLKKRWKIEDGTFFHFAHRVAQQLKPLFDNIVLSVRLCSIIHADETQWGMDGAKGYVFFFGNDTHKIFIFRHSRGGAIPLAILGPDPLPGTLITDRYRGYVALLKIGRQYCLVHIIRDVKKEESNFPDDPEVALFAAKIKPLLAEAIKLRNAANSLTEFLERAGELRKEIMALCEQQARHPAVQHIQNIFREEPERLFQWAKSPDIPADNNYAERAVRLLVISRAISFGSQSERGLNTREILMTVLHTAKCRGRDPAKFLEELLNILAKNPKADISNALALPPESLCDVQKVA